MVLVIIHSNNHIDSLMTKVEPLYNLLNEKLQAYEISTKILVEMNQ